MTGNHLPPGLYGRGPDRGYGFIDNPGLRIGQLRNNIETNKQDNEKSNNGSKADEWPVSQWAGRDISESTPSSYSYGSSSGSSTYTYSNSGSSSNKGSSTGPNTGADTGPQTAAATTPDPSPYTSGSFNRFNQNPIFNSVIQSITSSAAASAPDDYDDNAHASSRFSLYPSPDPTIYTQTQAPPVESQPVSNTITPARILNQIAKLHTSVAPTVQSLPSVAHTVQTVSATPPSQSETSIERLITSMFALQQPSYTQSVATPQVSQNAYPAYTSYQQPVATQAPQYRYSPQDIQAYVMQMLLSQYGLATTQAPSYAYPTTPYNPLQTYYYPVQPQFAGSLYGGAYGGMYSNPYAGLTGGVNPYFNNLTGGYNPFSSPTVLNPYGTGSLDNYLNYNNYLLTGVGNPVGVSNDSIFGFPSWFSSLSNYI